MSEGGETATMSAVVFLSFLRISAFLVSSPFPGQMTPGPVRVLLAGGLALAFSLDGSPPTEVGWIRAALVEVVLGLIIGFVLMLCMQAFALAGEVGGAQMGLSNAGLGNPLAIDVNLMGSGYTFLVLAVFVMGDGPARILILLERSFEIVPAGAGGWPMAETAAAIVGDPAQAGSLARAFFSAALSAAAPLIAAAFSAQILIGVLARAIPNLNWLVEGPSLTLSAGTIGLIASIETFAPVLNRYLLASFETLLRSLGA